ncbi:MAG: hypothetical protein CM1200mP4_3760 [Rhodospirillaceae bacterium]|nr:MAG: hypothetical protein CM1200mP4_3760 [Rhodospirillaceae bacterium]
MNKFPIWHRRACISIGLQLRPCPTGKGESYIDLTIRVTEVIKRLTNQYTGRDIIAVAHGGPIRQLLAMPSTFSATNCLWLRN